MLSEFGLVVVSLVLQAESFSLAARPKVSILGVHYSNEADLTREAEKTAAEAVEEYAASLARSGASPKPKEASQELGEKVRISVRGLFRQSINRKPVVHPQVIILSNEGYEEPGEGEERDGEAEANEEDFF
jgi:mRNA degradation ribonuclease J1/J2